VSVFSKRGLDIDVDQPRMIMCPSEVTCLSTDFCISELALNNPTQRVGLVQSGTHHYLIEINFILLRMI
jgi:hypothetical protein